MTQLSRFWTASIAYVALAVGAGLSIMYNVLDTIQVRGSEFDWADLVTAVAAPGIVLLMVEMFVSRIWDGHRWQIQVIRWLATLAIGGVAMRASWTHGHDFMASRGQAADVAIAWPLAIDLLAIMATALILAGRRGHLAIGHSGHGHGLATIFGAAVDTSATGQDANGHGQAMATTEAGSTYPVATDEVGQPIRVPMDIVATPEDVATSEAAFGQASATDWDAELAAFENGVNRAMTELGGDIARDAERYLAGTEPLPRRTPISLGMPEEAAELLRAWDGTTHAGVTVDILLAEYFGKSTRTTRRWRAAVLGSVSSPPSDGE